MGKEDQRKKRGKGKRNLGLVGGLEKRRGRQCKVHGAGGKDKGQQQGDGRKDMIHYERLG